MPPAALSPGDRIDRYVVESVLGVGNMATVYGVRHSALDKRYAVKLLHTEGAELQERLVREGRVQAALEHPNVVQVNDVFIHEGAPALLMERIDGPDLSQWLANYRPTQDEALAIFGGILAGVQAAHKQAVTHRDLKPGNVLLHISDEGLTPKVLDFGLAKALDPKGTNKTTAGLPMGTPWYMAPEQIRDASSADHRADVFSLGCILYELITGTICFAEEDMLETYRRIAQGLYPPPREFVPDLPYHITSAIEYALVTDPAKRTQDCDALGRALWKGGQWPSSLRARTTGAEAARQLHEQYEAHRAATGAHQAAAGPGLSNKGSGQLLDELTEQTGAISPVPQGRSWVPMLALGFAALLLLTTVVVAVGAVGAVVFLQ